MTEPLCLEKLPNLQSLNLYNCILRGDFQIAKNTLQLLEMRISSRNGVNGNLSSLIIQNYPQLTTLYPNSCELTSLDLSSLRQAKKEGMLPFLKHLNISENELSVSEFTCLFDGFYTWNELISLDIRAMFKESEDDKVTDYMNDIVRHGCLPSVQKL